ncbi:MAG TPA: Fic family protein [Dermatophilaceae bacterium]|nr:Fic family protein [Dermatophilaceae bacterium]
MPPLSPSTFLAVGGARAALAALDATAQQLTNPTLFRQPALRREAQSTSALEGTYVPLQEVLTADERTPATPELLEVFNYVAAAEHAFAWLASGRPLTVGLICDIQARLVRGTSSDTRSAGQVRDVQVVLGSHPGEPVTMARFIPQPPGDDLWRALVEVLDWVAAPTTASTFDPVVAAAMAHYQFETIHPFNDGNGRIGRLLVVLQLHQLGVLTEPTLTVSPWFEARRQAYYDRLTNVSADSAWNEWVRFFAEGLHESAVATRAQMLALVEVQGDLKQIVRASKLRADTAHAVIDFAVANLEFSVVDVQQAIGVTYPRANKLIGDLVDLGVLRQLRFESRYARRFYAPRVIDVITGQAASQ